MARVSNGTRAYGVLPEQPGGSRTLAAMRGSFAETRSLMGQAAMRSALARLGPNASFDDITRTIGPALAQTPEGQAQLLQLLGHRAAAEAMGSRYAAMMQGREAIAHENNQTRQTIAQGSQAIQGERVQALEGHYGDQAGHYQNQDHASLARVGVAQGKQRAAAGQQGSANALKAQGEVAKLLTPGKDGTVPPSNAYAAKQLSRQFNLGIPDAAIDRAMQDPETRAVIAASAPYDHNDPAVHAWTTRLAQAVGGGKTYAQALQEAGPPPANPLPKGRAGGGAGVSGDKIDPTAARMFKDYLGTLPSAQRPKNAADYASAWRDFSGGLKPPPAPQQDATSEDLVRANPVQGPNGLRAGPPGPDRDQGPTLARVAQPPPAALALGPNANAVPAAPAPAPAPVPQAAAPAPAPAAAPPAAAPAPAQGPPKLGAVVAGHVYNGGAPNDPASWEAIQ